MTRCCERRKSSWALVVRLAMTSAWSRASITALTRIQPTAKHRAGLVFGTRSPYLRKCCAWRTG